MNADELDKLKQHVTDLIFRGKRSAFEEAAAESLRYKLKWDDMVAGGQVFPELERDAIVMISNILGYKPPRHQSLPHEPFVRILIHQYRKGEIDCWPMFEQVAEHAQAIRNKEMERYADAYGETVQTTYDTCLAEYKGMARQRITGFLGYAPSLQSSMEAEILIRRGFADDSRHMGDKINMIDMHCINIIKYREVLLEQGKEAADNSKLIAPEIYKHHGIL